MFGEEAINDMRKMSTYVAIIALISTISCIVVYGATGKTVEEDCVEGTLYRYTDSKNMYSELACESRSHSTATGYNTTFIWFKGKDVVSSRSGLTQKGEIAKASSALHIGYADRAWWDIYEN